MDINSSGFYCRALSIFFISIILAPLIPVHAQSNNPILEEIVVTAQRREQSLQEVPVSIETFSGQEILRQGFRDMDELSDFSPTVNIMPDLNGQEISVRGFGTSGFALTLVQAVPTFLDGIHYGRAAMIKTAFMDVERIEVLKGPQPVFFGQSATAGAFSIISRKPTDVWEGNVNLDIGNHGNQVINAGVGGPINDSMQFRIAGKYDKSDGYLKDVITGDKLPEYKNWGGRVTFQWQPTDNLDVTTKLEHSIIRKDPEGVHACLTDGPLVYSRAGPSSPGLIGEPTAVWADPPKGAGWDVPHTPLDYDCFGTNKGVSAGGPFFEAPANVRAAGGDVGMIDIRDVVAEYAATIGYEGIKGFEDIDSTTVALDLAYQFDNGIELRSLTGHVKFVRDFVRDNTVTPFLLNYQGRHENFDQWSSELRLTSPTGGIVEWMVGGFWQLTDSDMFQESFSGSLRNMQRHNDAWEDSEWKTTFASLTFNFLDNKASVDLGARYTNIKKTAWATGYGASWIFDVTPTHPAAVRVDPVVDNPRIYISTADLTNLWTVPYRVASRIVPPEWRGPNANPVGLTKPDPSVRNDAGPITDSLTHNEIDPQVTLRYRPSDNHSVYFRWAQAFKAGSFDTAYNALPLTLDDFSLLPENAETFEIGAKGSLWERRAQYDVALYETTFTDLQLSSVNPDPNDAFFNVNAGAQRVRGIEFSTLAAVTDRLKLGISGAIMDGEMTNFPNAGCTIAELNTAPESGCDPVKGLIDRTGSESPRTPDWKVIFGANYWHPVFNSYKADIDIKAYLSDGFLIDVNGFTKIVQYNRHGDMNLSIGLGDMEDTWMVSAYVRNLFEARPSYNPEYDIEPDGIEYKSLGPTEVTAYGIKLVYNFR